MNVEGNDTRLHQFEVTKITSHSPICFSVPPLEQQPTLNPRKNASVPQPPKLIKEKLNRSEIIHKKT